MKRINLILLLINLALLLGIFWVGNKISSVEGVVNVIDIPVVVPTGHPSSGINDKMIEEKVVDSVDVSDVEIIESVVDDEVVVIEELLKEINLDVPFTSQAPEKNWDQPWQDACEEAVVLMLDAYYKGYSISPLFSKDEILKMVEWEEGQGWGYSIEAEKVLKLVDWYMSSKQIRMVEDPSVEEIKNFVAGGDPVLVLAYGKDLPNPHFSGDGPEYHALIIRGYDEDEFITNDPGTQFGENFKYKYDDLMGAIHDWNGGQVSEGKKVILVIE